MAMIRKARFRGTWYPYDSASCEVFTGNMEGHGNAAAAVLPHAGLFYSGALIKSFFDIIPEDAERVIILSPSHYFRLPSGTVVTAGFTESETPFGNVKTEKLDIPGIERDDVIAAEHGLEMFLPFIGRRGGLTVSYGVISSLREADEAAEIAARLLPLIDSHTLLIASSDFTHYGKRFNYTPYASDAETKVAEHDSAAAALLASGNGKAAYKTYRDSTICGIAPASIAAETAALLGLRGERGKSSTSLDMDEQEDGDDFVSYQTVIWRH